MSEQAMNAPLQSPREAGLTEALDRRHLMHPFADLHHMAHSERTVIARAKGNYVWDESGRRFLDGLGGMWCSNIGHGREEMADAISEQVRTLDYYSPFDDLCNPAMADLGAKLASYAPGDLNRVIFSTCGSTAADSAIRIVHHYWHRLGQPQRQHILTRHHAYHGSTYITASLSDPGYSDGWLREDGFIHHLQAPYSYRNGRGMSEAEFCDVLIEEMRSTIERIGPDRVACFIGEPIQGSGGVIVPPAGYHRRSLELCHSYGILYVSDEVVTAFGRLGHMIASEARFGITPDIITCAKGLTSGYVPLAATILSDRIHEVLSAPGAYFNNGFTYSGHPVACRAALKNIEIIEREKLCERVTRMGPLLEEVLAPLRELPLVGDVRGSHFMMCVEYVQDKEERRLFEDSARIGKRIWRNCQKRDLLVRPLAHLNVFSPPLTLEEDEIRFIGRVMHDAVLDTADELTREGVRFG
jgi:adenosylmethionine-8-amino-7-oxononanoate aminotransferase